MNDLAIIIEHYPRLSETFIRRQVYALKAPVYSHTIDYKSLTTADKSIPGLIDLSHAIPSWWKQLTWNLKVIRWKLYRYPAYHWLSASYKQLQQSLADQKPSVVLAQFGTTGINVMRICEHLNIPLIVHFHGKDATQLIRNRYYRYELKELFELADALVVVNEYMRNTFIELGCSAQKIHLIQYGVPVDDVYKPRKTNPNQPFQFLAVGRMVEKKAPILTIKAFETAVAIEPNIQLTMIGGGELLPEVAAYLSSSPFKEKIQLKGSLPFEEVTSFFQKSDAFVQHSIIAADGDAEGWPLAIGEACASGLPVIATKHMGIPTQIEDGKGGFLVNEGDYQAMGQKMAEMAQFDSNKYQQFSTAAYEHIKENGNFTNQANQLTDLINSQKNIK